MNFNRITLRRPLLVYSALLVVFATALYFLATSPLEEKIAIESDEIQKFHAKTENDLRKISRLPEYRDQATMIDADEPRLHLLLSEDHVVDFIREVEDIAKLTGGRVTISKGDDLEESKKAFSVPAAHATTQKTAATDTSGPETDGFLAGLPEGKTIGFTLTFVGTYPESVNFLHKVGTSPYFLDVLSVSVRPIGRDQNGDSIRSDIFSASVSRAGSVPRAATPTEDEVEAEFAIIVYLE
ncbi:MAG: hypothetical protein HGA33_01650 [Candidatus Moranbacteria bacterium]|nr:hypothetical protein [Candidatus Moranbacteria bacterium]